MNTQTHPHPREILSFISQLNSSHGHDLGEQKCPRTRRDSSQNYKIGCFLVQLIHSYRTHQSLDSVSIIAPQEPAHPQIREIAQQRLRRDALDLPPTVSPLSSNKASDMIHLVVRTSEMIPPTLENIITMVTSTSTVATTANKPGSQCHRTPQREAGTRSTGTRSPGETCGCSHPSSPTCTSSPCWRLPR